MGQFLGPETDIMGERYYIVKGRQIQKNNFSFVFAREQRKYKLFLPSPKYPINKNIKASKFSSQSIAEIFNI